MPTWARIRRLEAPFPGKRGSRHDCFPFLPVHWGNFIPGYRAQPESLAGELIERLLILRGGQVMPGLKGWSAALLPNGGEARLAADCISTYRMEPKFLAGKLVECLLILRGGQVMPGLKGWSAVLLPNGGEARLAADCISAYRTRPKSLAGELIERLLILRGGQVMPGLKGWSAVLLPNGGEARLAADCISAYRTEPKSWPVN